MRSAKGASHGRTPNRARAFCSVRVCLFLLGVSLALGAIARAQEATSQSAYHPLIRDVAPLSESAGPAALLVSRPFVLASGAQEMEDRSAIGTADSDWPFESSRAGSLEGTSALEVGGGFTLGPDTLLSTFEIDHFLTDSIAIGPLMQLGVSDDDFLFAPSLQIKAISQFPDAELERLQPFVGGGVGFAYIDKDGRNGGDDDVGFLFNFGFGVDYFVTDRLSIGSHALFNVLPWEVVGENSFFSWQVLTFAIHF